MARVSEREVIRADLSLLRAGRSQSRPVKVFDECEVLETTTVELDYLCLDQLKTQLQVLNFPAIAPEKCLSCVESGQVFRKQKCSNLWYH